VDAGHQADLGEMAGGITVRHPREDREVCAEGLQDLQIAARLVILAGLLGEEERGVQAEGPADQQQAFRLPQDMLRFRGASGHHRVQERQTDRYTGGAAEQS
jgi:hypothetical protein